MRRWLPWLGVAAAGLTLLLSIARTFVAVSAQRTASGSLDSAQRLFDARKAVAEAQAQLGDTDLKEGIEAGHEANAVALSVKRVTERIVRLLEPTGRATRATVASARRGVRGAVVARRETATAAEIIGAVDGSQKAATRYAAQTNGALRRILRAPSPDQPRIPTDTSAGASVMKRLDPRRVDWPALRKAPHKLAALILVIAILFTGIAWQVQAAAARALLQARELQERDTDDRGSPPPSTAENMQVLEVLDDSIRIRREIDDMLGLVEDGVTALRASQTESQAIAVNGRRQLQAIAGALGGSTRATRSSVARLRRLDSSLGTSVTLARLIAEELEELDRKLGPTLGRGP